MTAALREAEAFLLDVPPEIPHDALLAHARRVALLVAVHGQTVEPLDVDPGSRSAWHDVVSVGVGLSVVVDLHVPVEDSTSQGSRWAKASGLRGSRFRAAVKADVPRYEPPRHYWDCPVTGPRGGKCPSPQWRRSIGKYVTDPATGVFVWAQICRDHWDEVAAAANAAPDPLPNRGGVLARVFPEWNLDLAYQWAEPRYRPGTQIPGVRDYTGPPRLRLIFAGKESGRG